MALQKEPSILPSNYNLKVFKQAFVKPLSNTRKYVPPSHDTEFVKIVDSIEETRKIIYPGDHYDEVVGNDDVITAIEEAFLSKFRLDKPLKKSAGVNTFLLVGKPGVGKTAIMLNCCARVAESLEEPISLFIISASKLQSKWIGQAQKAIKALYAVVDSYCPSLLIFDEVDAMMSARREDESEHTRQFKTELLTEMEGMESKCRLITCASTNRGFDLDEAFTRRFHYIHYIREPNGKQRIEIFRIVIERETGRQVHEHEDLNFDEDLIIEATNGFAGGHIVKAVKKAFRGTFRYIVCDQVLTRKQYQELRPQLRGQARQITGTTVSLTLDMLMTLGIRETRINYDPSETDKMITWTEQNCENKPADDNYPVVRRNKRKMKVTGKFLISLLNSF